jgi:tight adherence protein B
MKFDSHLVFLILVFAAVFAAGQSVIGLVSVARQKRKVNRRLKVAERVDGVSALVMELRKQRGLDAKGERGRRLRWLSNLIVASGLRYEPKKWTVYAILAGLVAWRRPCCSRTRCCSPWASWCSGSAVRCSI